MNENGGGGGGGERKKEAEVGRQKAREQWQLSSAFSAELECVADELAGWRAVK